MLRLETLEIQNFRGIRQGRLESLTDVNILVGRNNCGKTTIFESISRVALVRGFVKDVLGRNAQIWQEGKSGSEDESLQWYRRDRNNEITIRSMFKNNSIEYYQPGVRKNQPKANVQLQEDERVFFSNVTPFRPRDAFNNDIEKRFWNQLLSNRRDKLLVSTLNEVFGLNAESFQLVPPNNTLTILFEDYGIPLDSQGDGTRAALRTLIVLAMLQDTIFMLEEPECHQHPGSLERFSSAICKSIKAQRVQLFISTHSLECASYFLKSAETAGVESAIFNLSLDHDGTLDARRLNPDAVRNLSSTGVDIRFLDIYG